MKARVNYNFCTLYITKGDLEPNIVIIKQVYISYEYCQNAIPRLSLMVKTLYYFLINSTPVCLFTRKSYHDDLLYLVVLINKIRILVSIKNY